MENICDLSRGGWWFLQQDRGLSLTHAPSQRLTCFFQGQLSHLEPSQDDGRAAAVLRHSGQGKGLYTKDTLLAAHPFNSA
jgi:hypothetical protein